MRRFLIQFFYKGEYIATDVISGANRICAEMVADEWCQDENTMYDSFTTIRELDDNERYEDVID